MSLFAYPFRGRRPIAISNIIIMFSGVKRRLRVANKATTDTHTLRGPPGQADHAEAHPDRSSRAEGRAREDGERGGRVA